MQTRPNKVQVLAENSDLQEIETLCPMNSLEPPRPYTQHQGHRHGHRKQEIEDVARPNRVHRCMQYAVVESSQQLTRGEQSEARCGE